MALTDVFGVSQTPPASPFRFFEFVRVRFVARANQKNNGSSTNARFLKHVFSVSPNGIRMIWGALGIISQTRVRMLGPLELSKSAIRPLFCS